MPFRPVVVAALCLAAAAAVAQGGPAEFDELPEPAQLRFCGLLLDTLLDRTVAELNADDAAHAEPLRKRAFVLAELRLANESLLYGSGSERDLRLSQALLERVGTLPTAAARPYVARCVAGAAGQADALRRDVGPAARNVVVEHFLAPRLPPPPTASAGPVALPPAPVTGGQDAWFPAEPARPSASAPVAER